MRGGMDPPGGDPTIECHDSYGNLIEKDKAPQCYDANGNPIVQEETVWIGKTTDDINVFIKLVKQGEQGNDDCTVYYYIEVDSDGTRNRYDHDKLPETVKELIQQNNIFIEGKKYECEEDVYV